MNALSCRVCRLCAVMALCFFFTKFAIAEPPLERVTLQLKWKHQFQFAGYYAAVEKGFYRDAGLEVTLLEPDPDKGYIDPVLEGKAEFGVATAELAMLRAQGKPVVVLAPIFQHSPLVLLASVKAGIGNVHEIIGKRIMIEPREAELLAYFVKEYIPLDKLKIFPNDYDTKKLIDGSVDAMSAYITDEPEILRRANFQYIILDPLASGIDFYGDTLFTTDEQIKNHRGRVNRFLDASLKGWSYAMAHQEEIADLILAKYSQRFDKAHLMYEAAESARLIQPKLVEMGYVNPGRWRNIAETYDSLGMVPKGASIAGLIYEPNPRPDIRWIVRGFGISLLITACVIGLAAYLYRVNATIKSQKAALQSALDEISILQGIIPICSYCKKIRDDEGAWTEVEHYLTKHPEAQFTHGVCTDCYSRIKIAMESGASSATPHISL